MANLWFWLLRANRLCFGCLSHLTAVEDTITCFTAVTSTVDSIPTRTTVAGVMHKRQRSLQEEASPGMKQTHTNEPLELSWTKQYSTQGQTPCKREGGARAGTYLPNTLGCAGPAPPAPAPPVGPLPVASSGWSAPPADLTGELGC